MSATITPTPTPFESCAFDPQGTPMDLLAEVTAGLGAVLAVAHSRITIADLNEDEQSGFQSLIERLVGLQGELIAAELTAA